MDPAPETAYTMDVPGGEQSESTKVKFPLTFSRICMLIFVSDLLKNVNLETSESLNIFFSSYLDMSWSQTNFLNL